MAGTDDFSTAADRALLPRSRRGPIRPILVGAFWHHWRAILIGVATDASFEQNGLRVFLTKDEAVAEAIARVQQQQRKS